MFKRYPVEKPVSPEILNEPIKFRTSKRVAKNRLLKGAMSERLGTWIDGNLQKSGIPTEQYINLYDKFGHGGFGTILTGNIMVDFDHLEGAGNVIIEESINNHERRQAFRDVSAAAKVDGSLIIGQISHCGSQTTTLFNPHPYSSSDVQVDSKKIGMEFGKPIALSIDEIQTLVIQKFIFAAKFLYETGFDGVEIHGANGFLLSQFMSPKSNKRTDEYGGSRENRIRIVLEIYNGIREVVPSETGFIVGIKMNSVEFENEGLSVEEAAWMCQEFERAGFDFIELSGGNFENPGLDSCKSLPTKNREGYFSEFARQIKPYIPHTIVFITGGFRTVPGMIAAIKSGFADGIGLSRPAAAEPDIARKMLKLNIQSATQNAIDDTRMQIMAAATQLVQAGKWNSAKSHQEATYGLMDTSNKRETDHFITEFLKHFEQIGKEIAEGKIVNIAFDLPILV